ncbi:MAG: pseudouridine synthase [Chitinophagaceae bacterium]|nr:pseudouridine synthase [Chitinophagaceae bacterium]
MSSNPFQRFKQKESGAKKKEKIRQEKKKARLETKEYFEQKKKAAKQGYAAAPMHDNKKKPGPESERKPFAERDKRNNNKPKSASAPPKQAVVPKPDKPQLASAKNPSQKNPVTVKHPVPPDADNSKPSNPGMPLNKFVAHAGICSRRDAADLVKSGSVSVNGKQIKEPGFKVSPKDEVKVNGKKITSQKNLVYILLNKPKDFITTTEDPQGRKTVMDIVKSATSERVYPIGRLDRNTTGVLLLTNDGELAQKLSHPSYQIKKIYEVKLDRPLHKKDFDTILTGVQLEDGFISPDVLAYADSKDKSVIGIEIHSGRNRIVRRIFEKLGYDVRNLDRVMYANLTKKNVERGKWRFLEEKEVRLLKYLNASIKKPNNSK